MDNLKVKIWTRLWWKEYDTFEVVAAFKHEGVAREWAAKWYGVKENERKDNRAEWKVTTDA